MEEKLDCRTPKSFHLILLLFCRLRDDADLRYLFEGKQKDKGRTGKYDGKIDFQNLNKKYAKLVS